MKLPGLKTIAGFFLAAVLTTPFAFGVSTALPGTINYVEGQAQIGSESLNSKSVGSVDLQAGQTISTDSGRTELLLTPGVFLRLDDNSSVKMISPRLTDTRVEIEKGRAMVEVAEIHKQNDIEIAEHGAETRLLKNGVYEFDADHDQVKVFDGKAQVEDQGNEIELKSGRELAFNSDAPLKAQKFDKKAADDFYNWNSLRSEYESEANVQVAAVVPSGYVGPGWFWDPYFSAYTFIPGEGIFASPFGWSFYSPGFAPFYYYGVPYRYYGAPYHYGHPGYYGHGRAGLPPSAIHSGAPLAGRGPSGFGGGIHGGIGGARR